MKRLGFLRKRNLPVLLLALLVLSGCASSPSQLAPASDSEAEPSAEPAAEVETLLVTATEYANGENDEDGIDLIVYAYDTITQSLLPVFRTPISSTYPANTVDFENQVIYYAASGPGEPYDNLYACDLKTGEVRRLTDGKYRFDDLLLIDGTLYANVSREGATTCQPARFDFATQTFTYRNEADDDTWHHSFSYDRYDDAFLILTCSDAEMRTHRVAAETYIRPKTISLLDKDLQTATPLFFTEDYEIYLTRRLDETTILMATEPQMVSSPRTLKQLDIGTQQVQPLDLPGVYSVYGFYPSSDGKTLYLIGKSEPSAPWVLYRFALDTQALAQIEFPEQPRQIIDLQITRQSCTWDAARPYCDLRGT